MRTADPKNIYVEVSGGVDSAVAAALLTKRGHHCAGLYMITCDEGVRVREHAAYVCERLGIELHTLDLRDEFENIISYFCGEYRTARTPNPCVMCNRRIKFGIMWDYARQQGAQGLATGQYARIVEWAGRPAIATALHPEKDQTYVLSMIDQSVLPHLVFPMGDFSKDQTRAMAAEFGLALEDRPESQEICFIPDDDYVRLLKERCPDLERPGNVLDRDGNIIGQHQGIHHYTIGQRRGLGIALHTPAYVISLNAADNTVTLGFREDLMARTFTARGTNWLIEMPQPPFRAWVKIRYNHCGAPATVFPRQANEVRVEFDEPVSAITPGQTAVFYIDGGGDRLLAGGAWIESARKEQA